MKTICCVIHFAAAFLPQITFALTYKGGAAKSNELLLCSFLESNCPYLRENKAIPLLDDDWLVRVNITLEYIEFIDLDDLSQTFTAQVAVTTRWQLPPCASWQGVRDVEAKLTPTQAENEAIAKVFQLSANGAVNLQKCVFSREALFHPDLLHSNSQDDPNGLRSNDIIEVTPDGLATMKDIAILRSSCDFDFRLFPFDTQTCEIQLRLVSEIANITFIEDGFLEDAYYYADEYSLWDMTNNFCEIEKHDNFVLAIFRSTYKRRYMYHFNMILTPVFVLTALILAAFAMPTEFPDRSGYAVTVFLAFSVQQGTFSSLLPKTSQPVYIFYYVQAHLIIAALVTIHMLMSCRHSQLDEDKRLKIRLGCLPRRIDFVSFMNCFNFSLTIFFLVLVNALFACLIFS